MLAIVWQLLRFSFAAFKNTQVLFFIRCVRALILLMVSLKVDSRYMALSSSSDLRLLQLYYDQTCAISL